MEIICYKFKLKPNIISRVNEWAMKINNEFRDDAIKSISNESVKLEAVFLDEVKNGDSFLIYIMWADSIKEAWRIFRESNLEVDIFHREVFDEITEERSTLQNLISLSS